MNQKSSLRKIPQSVSQVLTANKDAKARFQAFCASMPAVLLDMPHLKLDGAPVTPRDALFDLEQATERGRRIVDVIVAQGIVALTAPNESRFRK